MSNYDFSSLNDKEFEALSNDILSQHLDHHVERFKSGRDGGVDGRFFSSPNNEVVIQCKHWLKSGLAALLRSIKNTEALKVKKLNPSRYIFVTSLELSRNDKIKIKDIFSPYILSDEDVFGNEDLNDLLSKNPSIEKRHYKLWITSTTVLNTLLNSALVGRSKFKMEEIIADSRRYVMTQSHAEAMEKLESKHSIIITGAPGVGKTSLADQLCQHYVANNFEMCFIENSLNEAEAHYDEASKQVFYFDDFLGRNFLLALDKHQDSQVINFISRVSRDPKKRFILTSRSNILNQGKRLSDLFEIKHLNKSEYEISVSSLSSFDKAKILYNHIWFGQLEDSYIDEIYKNKRYHDIIKHENFNPRLISFITDSNRLETLNPHGYWNYIESTLSNPQGIWKNVFEVQLDETSKYLVIAISIHGVTISEEKLKAFYSRFKNSRLRSNNSNFDSIIRPLVGALLNRTILQNKTVQYDLFNPSIADFVLATYMDDVDDINLLLDCLKTTQAIKNITSLHISGGLNERNYSSLVESQLLGIVNSATKYEFDEYLFRLLESASDIRSPTSDLLLYLKELTEEALNDAQINLDYRYLGFLGWAIELGFITKIDSRLKIILKCWNENEDTDYDDFVSLSKLILFVEPTGGDEIVLTEAFKESLIDYVSEEITNDVIESGELSHIYDDDLSYSSSLKKFVSGRVSDIAIELDSDELEVISDCCNIYDIIQSNIESITDGDFDSDRSRSMPSIPSTNSTCLIDDLFEKG